MVTKSRLNRAQLIALLLPGLLVFAAFTVYPIIRLFWMSLCDMSFSSMLTQPFNGIANYKEVFQDQTFWTVFVNSIVYTLITVPGLHTYHSSRSDGNWSVYCHSAEWDQTIQCDIQSNQLSPGRYVMGHRVSGISLHLQYGRAFKLLPLENLRSDFFKYPLAGHPMGWNQRCHDLRHLERHRMEYGYLPGCFAAGASGSV